MRCWRTRCCSRRRRPAKYLKPAFKTDQGDNPGVEDIKAALEGARQILMERFAEDATLLQWLREYLLAHGVVESKIVEGKEEAGAKYADYFDYAEPINTIPSHRALAMLRGRREGMLHVSLRLDSEAEKPKWDAPHNPCEAHIAAHFGIRNRNRPADAWLSDTVRWTWRVKSFVASGNRADDGPAQAGRNGGNRCLRPQFESAAAGGARRAACHHGPRSRACAPA